MYQILYRISENQVFHEVKTVRELREQFLQHSSVSVLIGIHGTKSSRKLGLLHILLHHHLEMVYELASVQFEIMLENLIIMVSREIPPILYF